MKWETRALGEVVTLLPARSISLAGDAAVKNATSACLSVFGFRPEGIKTGRMWKKDVPDSLIQDGEILVARSNTPELVGNVARYRGQSAGVVASDLLMRLWPSHDVEGDYLSFHLSALFHDGYWKERAGGASGTMKKITRGQLAALKILLPPLPEQKRIAARLREQLAEVKKARHALQSQLDAAEKIHAAALRECFSDASRQAWPVKRLGDAADITAGVTLGRKLPSEGVRKVPYLRVANVKDGRLDLSHVTSTDAKASEIEALRLRFGDLLLTEGGDPDKLGRGTFWRDELPECIHQNHVFRLRFDLSAFNPAFLAFQFGSDYGKAYFLAHAKQTTGIATINRKVLDAFPLLSPSFAEQQAIAAKLTEGLTATQSLVSKRKARLEAVEKLPAALLREVFAGQVSVD